MGFFSWKTSDTGESIPNHYSNRPVFKVHMITEDGQVFTEDNYEGYGVFGGKELDKDKSEKLFNLLKKLPATTLVQYLPENEQETFGSLIK